MNMRDSDAIKSAVDRLSRKHGVSSADAWSAVADLERSFAPVADVDIAFALDNICVGPSVSFGKN